MSAFRYLQERLSLTPSKGPRPKPKSRRSNSLPTSVDAPFEKIYHYEVEQENLSKLANGTLRSVAKRGLSEEQVFHPQEVEFVKKLAELVITYQETLQTESPLKLQQALGGFPRNSTPPELVQLQSAVAALKGKVPGKHEQRKAKRLLQKYAQHGMILCETNTTRFSVQLTDKARAEVKNGMFLADVKLSPPLGQKCRTPSSRPRASRTKKARTSREVVSRPRRPDSDRVFASLCPALVSGSSSGSNRFVVLAPADLMNASTGALLPDTIPSLGDDFEMIDIQKF